MSTYDFLKKEGRLRNIPTPPPEKPTSKLFDADFTEADFRQLTRDTLKKLGLIE
jgi:hypothetical protein